MATETVIIDVNIEQADALQRARDLSNQIIVLRDTQDRLRESGQQMGVAYRQATDQIRQLESETRAYIRIAAQEEGSINSLRAQITLLNNQYNAMSRAEREGSTQGRVLTRQLRELREAEREASQAAGNFSTNVGNYTNSIRSAIQNMLPFGSETARAFAAVNSLSGAFRGAAGSMEVFRLALLSTGLGAALVVVGSLVTYMKDLDAATDGASQAMSGFTAVTGELGRSILNLDFKGLTDRMTKVGTTAILITETQQDFEDKILAQSVKTSKAQQEIAELRVKAMNRTLDPAERQKLLAQAEEIDRKDLAKRKELSDEAIKQAELSITLTGDLTKAQIADLKARGVDAALELQNNLVRQGKVTEAQTKQLADAYMERDRIQSEYTQRSEKRNNLSDKIADQQEQKEKQRQAALEKIAEDRAASELLTAQSIITIRQKELIEINTDINKRIELYRKYGQSTEQLEKERQVRIRTVRDKFAKEDLTIIQKNVREAQTSNIKNGISNFGDGPIDLQVARLQNIFKIEDVNKQIEDVKARMRLGETGLEELLQSFIQNRQAIQDEGNRIEIQHEQEVLAERMRLTDEANFQLREVQENRLQDEYMFHEARLAMNAELIDSYANVFGTIASLAGESSVAGKIAFGIEKALAIARIIINAEIEKSAIRATFANYAFQASFIPIGGAIAGAALIAAGEARAATVTLREVLSVGVIAAQTIIGIAGKAKGGLVTGPGSGTSDSIPTMLSNGESVMTARATKMFAPLLSQMNVAGGGVPFATGGIAGSYVPDISSGINSRNAISESIGNQMRGQKWYVAIEDIRAGDKRYVQVEQGGNF